MALAHVRPLPFRPETPEGIQLKKPRFRAGVPVWKRDLLDRGNRDPVWWIENVLGDNLWEAQRKIARAVREHSRVAVPAAFGVGKTMIAARLALWFTYNHRPAKVITTAPTHRQVKDLLWSELRSGHAHANVALGGEPIALQLQLEADQFAVGFSTKDYNLDYFTGYHSPNQMVIFDQASGLAKTFWDASEGLMTGGNAKWLAIGNTAIPDSEFANICIPERKSRYGKWFVIPITAHESPNVLAGEDVIPGIIHHGWVQEKIEQWGTNDPFFQVFVEAKFVESEQMVVIPQRIQDVAWNLGGDESNEIEIGLDVARRGTDSTVWIARTGSRGLLCERVSGQDLMTIVGQTIELKRRLEKRFDGKDGRTKKTVVLIKVDDIGVGGGVVDRLAELDLPVLPVNNAEAAAEPERFANVRAEMAFALREDMHAGLCGIKDMEFETQQDADDLEVDIRVQKYKILSSGRILLWDKDQIRKELDRSPDFWDAFVMAFEYPQGGAPAISVIMTTKDGKISSRPATDEEKAGDPDAGPDADQTLEDAVGSHEALDSFMQGDDDLE